MNILDTLQSLGLVLQLKLLQFRMNVPSLPGDKMDEQISLLLRFQRLMADATQEPESIDQMRRSLRDSILALKRAGALFEKVHSVHSFDIPGPAGRIPVRLYQPSEETCLPVFVLFHGGGWVMGDLDTHDNMARFISKRGNCIVLSIDYRLAPEHPFPAAVEDSFTAVCWAAEHAVELSGNPQKLMVGGDSAGGNLAAVVAQIAIQRGGPVLAGQVLLYAGINGAYLDTPSYREFGDKDYGLPKRNVEWFMSQYMPDPAGWLDPRASPLLEKDLHGLAPALIVTAEFDVLRDEAEEYAKKLEAAGVKTILLRCNGMTHGFLSMAGVIRRSEIYFDRVISGIKELFAGGVGLTHGRVEGRE